MKDEESSRARVMTPMEKVSLWLPATESKESIIDEKKKLNLLSQLNAIDDGKGSPYNPSFNSASKEINGIPHSTPDNYPPAYYNGYVSEQSKVGKKANLMTELFGDVATNSELSNEFDSQGSRPLKTSLKTTQNSGKSVKFYEKIDWELRVLKQENPQCKKTDFYVVIVPTMSIHIYDNFHWMMLLF